MITYTLHKTRNCDCCHASNDTTFQIVSEEALELDEITQFFSDVSVTIKLMANGLPSYSFNACSICTIMAEQYLIIDKNEITRIRKKGLNPNKR